MPCSKKLELYLGLKQRPVKATAPAQMFRFIFLSTQHETNLKYTIGLCYLWTEVTLPPKPTVTAPFPPMSEVFSLRCKPYQSESVRPQLSSTGTASETRRPASGSIPTLRPERPDAYSLMSNDLSQIMALRSCATGSHGHRSNAAASPPRR